MVAERQPATDG
ncbi:unnamed protein product, partial [Didymodactylos carnosus]